MENKSQPSIHVSASVWMVALFFLALASSSEARVFPSQSDIVIYVLKVSTSPLVTGMQTLYADVNE